MEVGVPKPRFARFDTPENGIRAKGDSFIDPTLVPMTSEEVAKHLKPKVDYVAQENTWCGLEMTLIADQLLRIEDGDPTALPGTDRQWRNYRIQLRAWAE